MPMVQKNNPNYQIVPVTKTTQDKHQNNTRQTQKRPHSNGSLDNSQYIQHRTYNKQKE